MANASAEARLIPALIGRLKEKFPLQAIVSFGSSVECSLEKDGVSVLRTLRALAINDDHGSSIVQKVLHMAMDVHEVMETRGATSDICLSLVVLMEIIADFLFARWYPDGQASISPLPAEPPHPLNAGLADALLQWLRKCLMLRGDPTSGLLTPYFPIESQLKIQSTIMQTGRFFSGDLADSLLRAVGRVAFGLSASNWETFYRDVQVPLLSTSENVSASQETISSAGIPMGSLSLDVSMFLAGWGLYDYARVRVLIQELTRVLSKMKRDRRNQLMQVTHHILWSWIELYTDDFRALITVGAGAAAKDSPAYDDMADLFGLKSDMDAFFDVLQQQIEIKKKPHVWPLVFLVLVLNAEKVMHIHATGKPSKDKDGGSGGGGSGSSSKDKSGMERRASFLELIQKALRKDKNSSSQESFPILVLDILKFHTLLIGTPAEQYLANFVTDAAAMGPALAKEVVASVHLPDSVPDIVIIELLTMVISKVGSTFLDTWRETASPELVALSLTCRALARLKKVHRRRLSTEHQRAMNAYLKPYIRSFVMEDDARSEHGSLSSVSKKSKHKDWSASELPFIDMLHTLEVHSFLIDDAQSIEFLYQVMTRCIRPLQHKAVQVFLQLTVSPQTSRETMGHLSTVLQALQRLVVRSDDAYIQVHGMDVFTQLFELHTPRSDAGSQQANAIPVPETPASVKSSFSHTLSRTDSNAASIKIGERPTLDWAMVHSELEAMLMTCQTAREQILVREAVRCLQAVLKWNATAETPLFSTSHNRVTYAKWKETRTLEQFSQALTELEPTAQIQTAKEAILERLATSNDSDMHRYTCFLLASPSTTDTVTRAFQCFRLNRVHPSVFSCIHPSNLTHALNVLPSIIDQYDEESLGSVFTAISSYALTCVSANLNSLFSGLLPRVSDRHAVPFCNMLIKSFNQLWWDTALLDPLLDRLASWIDIPALTPSCMAVLENVCKVTRFYHPTTSTGRARLQQLLPYVITSESHATNALKFGHIQDFLIATGRLQHPDAWVLPILDRLRDEKAIKLPTASHLLSNSVLHALNSVVPLPELDEVAASLYHFTASEGREVEVVTWLVKAELDVTSQPQTFLRSNGFAVKLASLAVKDAGAGLLLAVHRPLSNVADEVIELDPGKEQSSTSFDRLTSLCESVMASILESAHTVAPRLRNIFKAIADIMATKFPTYRLVGVGNLVFLRLLCPAIMSMNVPLNQRARTLVAKCIQNTVNGVYFGGKEEYMAPMNTFVAKYLPRISPFLEELCNVIPISESPMPMSPADDQPAQQFSSLTVDTFMVPSPASSLALPPLGVPGPARSMSKSSTSSALANGPLHISTADGADVRFSHTIHKYRDAMLPVLSPADRVQFVQLINALPVKEPHFGAPLDSALLPPVMTQEAMRDEAIGYSTKWFYKSGTSRLQLPVFTLVLQHVPLQVPIPGLLTTMYHELRHSPSVPVVIVVDASFSVSSSSTSQLLQQFFTNCCIVIDKLVVAFCTEQVLQALESTASLPPMALAPKLEVLQEHVSIDCLPPSRQALLTELASKPVHLTTLPVGQLQLAGSHVMLTRAMRGKAVHELYHVSELAITRTSSAIATGSSAVASSTGPAPISHGILYAPRSNRFAIFRLATPHRHSTVTNSSTNPESPAEVVSLLMSAIASGSVVPDLETCRANRTSAATPEHPAGMLYHVLLGQAAGGGSLRSSISTTTAIPESSWPTITHELCAHVVLATSAREKLLCVDRLCDLVVTVVPPTVWARQLISTLVFLSIADPAVAEVAQRQLARSMHGSTILEELLRSLELGYGAEHDMLIETVMANHIKLMSSHNETVYERLSSTLRQLFRQHNPSSKLIIQQARFLRTSLSVIPRALTDPAPSLIWTLYVTTQLSSDIIADAVRADLYAQLWHSRTHGDWTSFTERTRVALLDVCRDHLTSDGIAFVPALRLLNLLASSSGSSFISHASPSTPIVDETVIESMLFVLRDRTAGSTLAELPADVLDLVDACTALVKHMDADITGKEGGKCLVQLAGIGMTLLGIYGASAGPMARRLVASAVQLTVQALQVMDEQGMLVENTLERVMAADAAGVLAAADKAFGVSMQAHFSISVGLVLSKVSLNHRVSLEPLVRLLINLAKPGTIPVVAAAQVQVGAAEATTPTNNSNSTPPSPSPVTTNLPDALCGYLFPIFGSRQLATLLFPYTQGPRSLLSNMHLVTASRVLMVSHLLQQLDLATVTGNGDAARWVLDWLEAVYAESPTLFALVLEAFTECTERIVSVSSGGAGAGEHPNGGSGGGTKSSGGGTALSNLKRHASHGGSSGSLLAPTPSSKPTATATPVAAAAAVALDPSALASLQEAMWRACDLLTTLLGDTTVTEKVRALRETSIVSQTPSTASSVLSATAAAPAPVASSQVMSLADAIRMLPPPPEPPGNSKVPVISAPSIPPGSSLLMNSTSASAAAANNSTSLPAVLESLHFPILIPHHQHSPPAQTKGQVLGTVLVAVLGPSATLSSSASSVVGKYYAQSQPHGMVGSPSSTATGPFSSAVSSPVAGGYIGSDQDVGRGAAM